SLQTLPTGLFTQTHLWFLYYLAIITALALGVRAVAKLAGRWQPAILRCIDAAVAWIARSSFGLALLAVPTAGLLWFMQTWSVDTPDQTLVPEWPVVLVYGGGFGLGWWFGRQPGALDHFTQMTWGRWAIAAASVVATLQLTQIQLDPGNPHFAAAHGAFVVTYAVMMWSLVTLTIGGFRVLCRRPRAWVRYVADSSYWMYLVHLPLVVWLQVAVAEFSLHWTLKLAGIVAAVVVASLISYDLFVRSTFIGRVLNGRRQERMLLPWLRRGIRVRFAWRPGASRTSAA
ncbi:MAG TPA: acyltransferase family protein, partial [Opitutus sp.]|nr:acyltransferase family protein [Opitutus sp.]